MLKQVCMFSIVLPLGVALVRVGTVSNALTLYCVKSDQPS